MIMSQKLFNLSSSGVFAESVESFCCSIDPDHDRTLPPSPSFIIPIIPKIITQKNKKKQQQIRQKKAMSIKVKFLSIQVLQNVEVLHQQTHLFELEIFNRQHKENMKFTFHTIKDGWIDLPNNFFIVGQNAKMCFRIQEKNQRNQLEKVLSFGEFDQQAVELYRRRVQDENNNLKKIVFETFNQKFKVAISYLCAYDKNLVFTGHFYDLLKNQGYSTLSLISLNESNHKINVSKEESTAEFAKHAPTEIISVEKKIEKKPWSFKNCFKLCDQVQGDEDYSQIPIQQQLPPNISANINQKLQTPKKKSFSQLNSLNNSTGVNQIKQNTKTKQTKQLKYQTQEQQKQIPQVSFFKGSCKNKNLFSCLDASVDEEQIAIFQPVYR